MNDIFGLYLSYYSFNSPLFFLFGCLIFVATLVCINLLRAVRIQSQQSVISMEYIYKFFKDLVGFEFLRKQNMSHQNRRKPVTRIVRFKKPFVETKVSDPFAPLVPPSKPAPRVVVQPGVDPVVVPQAAAPGLEAAKEPNAAKE